ncbi:hypothetical protein [Providencia stuartii]|uniref:Glycosyl transferase family 1 domain-containing protein n=1 Tax=Providencia stuartii TaxID=588 RepID=A0A1S1HQG6_PROST|nr:hypothetical protein [Providencia stuartii]OHT22610.1 hypothetical protein A3Q29_10870 [Providencia stuartii]
MLFVTKYENKKSTFGGMVRVKDIESICEKAEFLSINLKKPFDTYEYINDEGNKVYNIGLLNIFKIIKILKSHDAIYFHTVGNFIKLFPYISFIKKKKKFIDLHGSQPEEFSYSGAKFRSSIFSFFEKKAFKHCNIFIHVSHNMIKHFRKKYPYHNKKDLYVPIFSSDIDLNKKINFYLESKKARDMLSINDDKPIFLYSGGVQAWQKIDLIIKYSKNALNSGYRVIILSMQKKIFQEKLSEFSDNSNLLIESVSPNELYQYYLAANYGLMFRDDNILNIVSSPTKMSEYLYYGMKPVLTSTNVGDFVSFGIEYINFDNNINLLNNTKSDINHDIICEKLSSSDKELLARLINE